MKQLLQNLKNGKTSIEDVPVPTPRAGQALIKVSASLVSAGTERMVVEFAEKSLVGKARSRPDLVRQVVDKMKREGVIPTIQAAFNRLDQPIPLGYSSSGTIVALGPGMDGFRIGQRVACAGGGYAVHAEYNLVPRSLLTILPENVDLESAAFTTLGAIALHGFRLAQPELGESVAIIGMGLLGLLAGQIASAAGCRVLGIDTNPQRVALASSLDLHACLREAAEQTATTFTSNRGFDFVLICADTASNDPVELAAVIARDRARIVATGAVGLTFPRKIYYEKELSFINSRSYGPGRYDSSYEEQGHDYPIGYVRWTEGRNFEAIVQLLSTGKLNAKALITHRFPIEQAQHAYEVITGRTKEPFLGILLTYPSDPGPLAATKIIITSAEEKRGQELVRLGMLGAGNFANGVLLPAIRRVSDVKLVGISSPGGQHAQNSAKKFGFAYASSNEEEILNDPEINTVAVLTRHDSHAGLVVKALRAGKHVFVEKPLAIDRDQLSALIAQLSISPAVLLTAGFNRRFSPLGRQMAGFLENRNEPLYVHYRINAGYIPLNHWIHDPSQGGGRIIGEGCHFIDFITFLVGMAPSSVATHALPDNGKYSKDNVSMTFSFPDGSVGIVDYLANGDKSLPKERVEAFCAGSVCTLDDFRSLELTRNGKRMVVRKAQDKGWLGEWIAFAQSIKEGGSPPIPYEQLVGVTNASFAAIESLHNGSPMEISMATQESGTRALNTDVTG